MQHTYRAILCFPPGKGIFCKNKESFLGEYLNYAGYEDGDRRDEAKARINFYLNSHDFHYVCDIDIGKFFFKADSFQDAYQRMSDIRPHLENVVQMEIKWILSTHNYKKSPEEMVDIIQKSNASQK